MLKKTLNLKELCPEKLVDLKRLDYEIVTKERILSLALTLPTTENPNGIEMLYREYRNNFIEYEELKTYIYTEFISMWVENPKTSTWDLDFNTGDVNIYEN